MKDTSELKLSDRLLRYSATASLLTAGLLATTSQPSVAGTTITNVYGSEGDLVAGESLLIDMDGADGWELSMKVNASLIYALAMSNSLSSIGIAQTMFPGFGYPVMLNEGDLITSAQTWLPLNNNVPMVMSYNRNFGYWRYADGTQKNYMGVRFLSESDSSIHYGWIEMTVTSDLSGTSHVIVHRTGIDTPAGMGLPASVELAGAQGTSGLQAAAASAFAALGGALTWLRRKLGA